MERNIERLVLQELHENVTVGVAATVNNTVNTIAEKFSSHNTPNQVQMDKLNITSDITSAFKPPNIAEPEKQLSNSLNEKNSMDDVRATKTIENVPEIIQTNCSNNIIEACDIKKESNVDIEITRNLEIFSQSALENDLKKRISKVQDQQFLCVTSDLNLELKASNDSKSDSMQISNLSSTKWNKQQKCAILNDDPIGKKLVNEMSIDVLSNSIENMKNFEDEMKNIVLKREEMEKKLKDKTEHEEVLLTRITDKDTTIAKMCLAIEAYEQAIVELIAQKEEITPNYEEQIKDIKAERDLNKQHLESLEITFSDLHLKYERSKQLLVKLKANEEELQAENKRNLEILGLQEQRYEKVKNHAIQQLEISNSKMELGLEEYD
ncbi:kinesin-related protein 4-like [Condylostylus longicornis]|uniref:kinesin-related protein 4-like n=1 Tax=Condylostylus longicornis TaxID=2530218 RepID=UPI00244DBBEA|nr:kinesin-related protein 4-like [Condylostylus longicornis]